MKIKKYKHQKNKFQKIIIHLFILFLGSLTVSGCKKYQELKNKIDSITANRSSVTDSLNSNVLENSKVEIIKKKLQEMGAPQRVELRSYIKDHNSRYKKDVDDIRNLKVKLDYESAFYIEINLFTDEASLTAPLTARVMKLDIRNNNLIEETNINLN